MSTADLTRFRMEQVTGLSELCQLLHARREDPAGTVLLAGGTDFLVEVSQGPVRPDPLPLVVDVSRLAELRGIESDGRNLRIGAAATYLEIQRHPLVRERAPLLERMTHDIGGPTIQARGTLGGNLATASPAADGVAAIAAFDPVIEVASVRGRRRIPMEELQTGYKRTSRERDEAIVAIELVLPPAGSRWCWRKVGTRLAQAISKVALAAVAADGRLGLAMASVAPITALMPKTRALLSRGAASEAELDAAVEADISPIDDIRSTRRYRLHCAKALIRAWARELRG